MHRRMLNRRQRKAFSHFFSHATMNAITHIHDDVGIHRWLWVLILITASTVCIQQLVSISQKFLSHPVKTETSIEYTTPKTFPAVTICNLNPMKYKVLSAMKKKASKSSGKKQAVTSSYEHLNEKTSQVQAMNDLSNFFDKNNTTFLGGDDSNKSSTAVRQDRYELDKLMFLMNTINKTMLEELTYDIEDLLIDCSFDSRNCPPRSFVSLNNSQYGKCFVFNSGYDSQQKRLPIKKVINSGDLHSFEVTLFVDQGDYLPSITEAGYKFIIHDQGYPPMPQDEGIMVGPGFFTSLSLRHSVFQAAKPPYGNCRDFTKPDNISMNMYLQQLPLTMPNEKTCVRTCEQRSVIKYCHCYSLLHGFQMADAFTEVRNETNYLSACSVEHSSRGYICMHQVLKNVSLGIIPCKDKFCKYKNCHHNVFATTRSAGLWPTLNTFSAFLELLKKHKNPAVNRLNATKKDKVEDDEIFIRNNFLRVRVYFEDLSVINLITEASYNVNDLLADIGGITCLWLGLSVITVFDTLELIIDLCRAIGSGKKERRGGDDVDEAQDERKLRGNEDIEMT